MMNEATGSRRGEPIGEPRRSGPTQQSASRFMSCAASANVRRSVGDRRCSIARSSQASRRAGMLARRSLPAGVIETSIFRASVGSDSRATTPSSQRAATVDDRACGRTHSAAAKALSVVGPSLAMRFSVDSCDHVQRELPVANSVRSRALRRSTAHESWWAMWQASGTAKVCAPSRLMDIASQTSLV